MSLERQALNNDNYLITNSFLKQNEESFNGFNLHMELNIKLNGNL